jgi:urea transporter/murein DD-endopeptidase MepM/ murein hydrolase activator NlpD
MNTIILKTVDSVLYSYAQIFFSNRKWFGAAAMASTFIVPQIGIMGLVGVLLSNIAAYLLKFDKEKIESGFYGFNGLLFGAASVYFFEITPFLIFIILLFIIICFFISAALEHLLANLFNLPGLSLPFVLTLYIFFVFTTNYDTIFFKGLNFEDYNFLSFIPEFIKIYLKSFSLILFQSSLISGIILVIAVLFFSRIHFVNSVLAFTINYFFVNLIFPQVSTDLLILTSFNSILCSFALGGSLIIVSRKSIFLIIVSSIMIIVFSGFFSKLLVNYLLPVLVLPFNFVVLSTIYSLKFRKDQTDLVLLYFKPGSPEENFYYHDNRKNRFTKFKNIFPELPIFGEWKISQGIEGKITHKEAWRHAWDFVITDGNDKEFKTNGEQTEDYYCFNTPIASLLDGEVARVIENVEDNKIGEINHKQNWGNTIIIDHGEGLFSSLSHLKLNSVKVKKGDNVKKGQIIAHCGNSGRSPQPHLHFQFQLTDKLGDKTFEFPISHFLEKENSKFILKSFDFPKENTFVRNIETHKALKKAFDFQLGDEFKIEYNLNGEIKTEHWEVDVDMLNNVFIKSNNDAKVYLYPREKVFYLTHFYGNKKSALYHFYLTALSVPLGYLDNLEWQDNYPVSSTVNSFIKYLSELTLMFMPSLESYADFNFEKRINGSKSFIIKNHLVNKGKGLYRLFSEEGDGQIEIDFDGFIKSFSFNKKNLNFTAKIKED